MAGRTGGRIEGADEGARICVALRINILWLWLPTTTVGRSKNCGGGGRRSFVGRTGFWDSCGFKGNGYAVAVHDRAKE